MITIEEDKKNRPVSKTNILLSKTAIDDLVIACQNVDFVDKSNFKEYTTSSGKRIMLHPGIIAIGEHRRSFQRLFGQTYPVHNLPCEPFLMTDYIFLATEDGKKGAPWTRDPNTFEFFIRAAQLSGILHSEYIKDGKRYIDSPYQMKFIYSNKV